MDFAAYTIASLDRIRENAPLIHNITNFVVMNSSANMLLAIGASPVMAHCGEEVEEMTGLSSALVLNIGTLQENWVKSMVLAGRAANAKGIPVILDPVGAGATRYRTEAVRRIMGECKITALRGNASEVLSLGSDAIKTKGVDAAVGLTDDRVAAVKRMAGEMGCIVAVSGAEDCITDGNRVYRAQNGHPLMTKVTGGGCGLSAIGGAFCAVSDGAFLEAVTAAFAFYGMCAELAAENSGGPGSFYVAFLDWLHASGSEEISDHVKVIRRT